MFTSTTVRLYAALTLAAGLYAAPASAQYQPRSLSDPATGETYHIEGAIGFWNSKADMTISSSGVGIPGSQINLKDNLGLTDSKFSEFHITLRPARKHKLRFQYIPIKY